MPLHRPHRVGEHEHAIAALERGRDHARGVGVHEGLAAGEADLLQVRMPLCRLVQEAVELGTGEMDQPSLRGVLSI